MTQPPNDLERLLSAASVLLLDFDGPVCSVFANVDTDDLADHLRGELALTYLPASVQQTDDPMVVLAFAVRHDDDTSRRVEATLTAAELDAIRAATPTQGAVEAIDAAHQAAMHVAIVSNNSTSSIDDYLDRHGLETRIRVVAGRQPQNARLLKPDPHLLVEALTRLDARPADAVFVGDSPSDMTAATAANVVGIGYANKPGKTHHLRQAGATAITTDMAHLAAALRNYETGRI